jgi:hypothetical protein
MGNFFTDLYNTRHSILLQHQFDKTPTLLIVLFEVLVLVFTASTLLYLVKTEKKVFLRFLSVALGIFIFEFFTSPMWNNFHMGAWAYVYQDVSWVLTFGWASMILTTIVLIDKYFSKLEEWKRFSLYLLALTIAVVILEAVLVHLGIRSYSPETREVIRSYFFFGTPVAVLYYVPVFMSLVISFYKYWSFMIFDRPIMPIIKRKWLRSLFISFLGVFLFEIMIEPMVVNARLPSWSYVYRDVSFLITGGWIILVWLSINFIDKVFIHFDLFKKFLGYLLAIFILALPCEAWLMNNGYRVYSHSTTAAFSGFVVPVFHVPAEVAFAIPFYFALILSFVKYWEIILDNKR